tara:strand:- start:6499 stop:6834 length:336 start_codon:yes stop_codon:yes gene_type:complete
MTPAIRAQRLLLGTGLGLLLASGMALISGVISIEEPEIGFIFPLIGLILLVLAGPTGKGQGPLGSLFPNESNDSMAMRIETDLMSNKRDDDVGNAWAKLEHTMLSKELEEE